MAFQQFDPLSYLRQQSMFDNMGGANVADNHLFTNPTPPPDPFGTSNVMGGTTFGPPRTTPKIQTQDSVLADQTTGPMHPAESANLLRLKSILDSFNPDTRANDRLNNLLDTMPQINTPTIGRRIAAAGAAIGNVGPHFTSTGGGQEAADKVNFAPYIRDMATFKEKVAPFESAATLENNRNIQDRTLITNLIAAQAKADDDASRSADADKKLGVAQQDANTRQMAAEARVANDKLRTEVLDYKARHPEAKWDTKGPTVLVMDDTGVHDTGLKTGMLGTMDKLEFDRGTKLAVVGAQGTNQMNVQGAITGRGNAPKPPKGLLPSQTATDRINRANEMIAKNPALGKYIHVTGKDIQTDKPAPKLFGLLDKPTNDISRQYQDAIDYIYGTNTPAPNPQAGPSGGGGGGGNTGGPDLSDPQRQKAADMLKAGGKNVSDVNIDYLIKSGVVK